MENAVQTIPALRRRLTEFLISEHVDDAQCIARDLLCDTLQSSATQLFTSFDTIIENEVATEIMNMAKRIAHGEPLQYVTGKSLFMGNVFRVRPGVLIPRPETAELVSWIVNVYRDKQFSLLDIGTGSGCIALSVKLLCENATVTAIDVSSDALDVAKENARLLNVDAECVNANIFSELQFDRKFDVVVSNPPYVRESEKIEMQSNVLDYEPHIALFVPDDDALRFYRRIAQLSMNELLVNGGNLFFEINAAFGNEICEMLRDMGFWNVELRKDINGRDRMVGAQRP